MIYLQQLQMLQSDFFLTLEKRKKNIIDLRQIKEAEDIETLMIILSQHQSIFMNFDTSD